MVLDVFDLLCDIHGRARSLCRTVLVDPKLTDILIAGMGIGAIWVEIVHVKDAEGS